MSFQRILVVFLLTLAVTFSTACPWDTPVNDAIAQIDKATNDINANSAQWQNIINQLPSKLKGKIDDTIQNELTHFVEHSAGVVSQQLVCTSDILAKRALIFLNKLKNAVLGGTQKINLTAPTVCQVPSTIELAAMPKGHRIVEASGADFNLKDDGGQLMSVAFWSDSKQQAFNIDESKIGRNTNYNLALNLDGEDISNLVLSNEVNKILFYWNNSNVQQPQVLVLKHVPQTNEVIVPIGAVSLIPFHVGGDKGTDINDDNPFEVDLLGKTFLSTDGTKVLYNLYMKGRERQPDNTTVEGWWDFVQTGLKDIQLPFGVHFKIPIYGEGPGKVAYSAPPGWKIVSFSPMGPTTAHINITKHGNQNMFQGDGQVVREFVVNGGQGGGEAGNQTGVVATFSNLTIKIVEQP